MTGPDAVPASMVREEEYRYILSIRSSWPTPWRFPTDNDRKLPELAHVWQVSADDPDKEWARQAMKRPIWRMFKDNRIMPEMPEARKYEEYFVSNRDKWWLPYPRGTTDIPTNAKEERAIHQRRLNYGDKMFSRLQKWWIGEGKQEFGGSDDSRRVKRRMI